MMMEQRRLSTARYRKMFQNILVPEPRNKPEVEQLISQRSSIYPYLLHSLDLTAPDSYLWDLLKEKISKNKPRTNEQHPR
nr:unnamed protein product [Callosobruchus analis]